jgi:RES domain-containing protein
MKVFRIEREIYLNQTLSGMGAAKATCNRWNSQFTPLIYTSAARSLALLELAVHLDLSADLPTDRYWVEIEIDDDLDILEISLDKLPLGWNDFPPSLRTQMLGDWFVRQNQYAVMKVPSSIVPQEFNYLIHPMHPDMAKITMVKTEPIIFDSRFKKL